MFSGNQILQYLSRKSLALSLCLIGMVATSSAASASNIVVNASVDSTQLIMGDRTRIHVEVLKTGHAGTIVNLPKIDQEFGGMDVIDVTADSSALGNDRWQVNYNILVQAFEPGALVLEPFKVVVDGDTVKSDRLTLKVLPVELSPELGDPNNVDSLKIHPNESVSNIKSKWYDVFPEMPSIFSNPWFWLILGVVLITLAGLVLYMLYKKNGKYLLASRVPPIPPYELALQRFEILKTKRLAERGEEKLYYTELTDILRQYLEGRFGINAMEMTSTQIMRTLRENKDTRMSADQMQKVLEIADFVKFAKVRPLPDDNIKAFNNAMQFVEETKPVVEPDPAANPNTNNINKN